MSLPPHPAVWLDGVVSHQCAALLWGMELVQASAYQHVTLPRSRRRARGVPGVRLHRQDLADADVVARDGVLLTRPARTVIDLSRTLPMPEAVAVADSALRAGVLGAAELGEAVAALRPAVGRPQCREVLLRVDHRSGSVLESLARVLLEDGGLRPFETQHVVRAGGSLVARVDVAWPEARVAVELDGYAFHADRARYRSDRRRLNGLVLAGWQVLRFSWEDVTSRPDVVVGQVRLALHTSRGRHAEDTA